MFSGKDGSFKIGATTVKLDTWSLDLTADAHEVSSFGDKDKVYVPGIRDAKGTFSGSYESTDPGQAAITSNFESTNSVAETTGIFIYYNVTGSIKGWQAAAILTGVTIGTALSGKCSFSGSMQISGGVTAYTTT